jgi:hypothetical protein
MTPAAKKTKPEKSDVVRTSLILPHHIWAQAKALAAAERKDLRDLIIEGLKLVLAKKGR